MSKNKTPPAVAPGKPAKKSPRPALSLSVQYPDPRLQAVLSRPQVRRWVQAALLAPAQLTLRFVDAAEGQALNRDYRGKDYATNVLTFAYSADADEEKFAASDDLPTQADIVLCTDVLESEAAAQGKSVVDHAAHLIVHGVLHAQGYDHENNEEAEEMEQLEIEILARCGLANPYLER
ncbi:rRNA maturation RNase YbeY [Herbaspirillum sp. RTI4]|uniref:rRNA maturation RNase YbeY n=1 Tax=Herbaspirillum sp. RTI4 TaxID=3048640 RepID=UPI002AB4B4C1|nr:rRNA maturation RNase YbeY [Herbaspirillum sp. RTI4]MDY7576750.1 rRNA maturation RNase YbeY [Herbaspirillum sp. RTI4]MEA9981346.1 rRNA maturation RNase YbeY [Herbaspirillum sp. RTI4]